MISLPQFFQFDFKQIKFQELLGKKQPIAKKPPIFNKVSFSFPVQDYKFGKIVREIQCLLFNNSKHLTFALIKLFIRLSKRCFLLWSFLD